MERRKRRWWTRGISWLSLVAITAALLSGLFQLAVAMAPGYRDEVAQRASIALGQPVQVDALSLRWRWLWPLLELNGVRLLDARDNQSIIDVSRIRLGFALAALLRGEWIPGEVEVQGLSLALQLTEDGQLKLKGRVQNQPAPSFVEIARQLKRFSRLRAEDVALSVEDLKNPAASFTAQLQRGDLRLDAKGFELRAEVQAPEFIASRLRLRAGITGDLATPEVWQGRWTLDASGLIAGKPLQARWPALAALQASEAAVTAAGDWQDGKPGAAELSLRAQTLSLRNIKGSLLKEVDLGLHYRPSTEGGTVDLVPLRLTGSKGAWPTTSARLEWRREGATETAATQWSLNSDFLRLDDLAPWAAAFWPARKPLPTETLRSLRGDLHALEGRMQREASGLLRYSLHMLFSDVAARWPEQGGVQGLNGELSLDQSHGQLKLRGEGIGFALPKAFETEQRLTRLGAEAQWQRDGDGWRVTVPRLEWALLGSSGRSHAELRLPDEGSPTIKLDARFDVADVAALKPLMPLRWGQPLKDWLDRALVRGRISNAVLAIDGPLADFPFHKNPTGHWSLLLPVVNARLEYHRDWPGADQLAATLQFKGNGLQFAVQRALINGVAVTRAKGGIADFAESPLLLDGTAVGEAPFYYRFLRASPLATRLQGLLAHTEVEGQAETDVHLEIPLHSKLGQKAVVSGDVRLLGNTLRHNALDRPVRDITGSLRFGGGVGVAAENLQGSFYDQPITAHIAANAEGSDELQTNFQVDYDPDEGLAARYVPRWLKAQLQGASDWRLAIPLSGPRNGHVLLESDLVGLRAALPSPLGKSASERLPLRLEVSGGDAAAPLRITGEIPGRLGLALRFTRPAPGGPSSLRGIALHLGEGAAPAPPSEEGLSITGNFDTLAPSDWRGVIAAIQGDSPAGAPSAESLPFLGADLSAKRLRFAEFDAPDVRVQARREHGGYVATLQGSGTAGAVRLNTRGDAFSGAFTTLRLQAAPKTAATTEGDARAPIDPQRAPTLDLQVDALEIGGRGFGALQLISERSANGQRLRTLTLTGGIASLTADGEWRRSGGQTEAQTRFALASDDLAGTLSALGFAPTVSGRNARINGDLIWPAAAGGFDWAQGRGTVNLAVDDGALRTVDPGGTSRVLGLLNFYALPRRLTLDFGDVVSKGLGFDRIEGTFQLAKGVAHTDGLSVRGPSLKMEVRGDVGLAAHDYNQIITVTPNTTGITLGALLIGGAATVAVPVLPIIAVIANQVIDRPLAQVTQLTYGLTGSWDNPEIKKLDSAAQTTKAPAKGSAKP